MNIWKKSFDTVAPEVWKNSVSHTKEEIRKWYEREHVLDRLNIQPIIIDLDSDSSDFESDSDIICLKKIDSKHFIALEIKPNKTS